MPTSDPSSLPSTPDAAASVQLKVRTDDELAEVAVLDGHLNNVASAVGGLVRQLPRGLYKINVRTGAAVQQRLVSLEQDADVEFGPSDQDAPPVKVLGAESAELRTLDRGSGSLLTVWIQDPASSEAKFDRHAPRMLSVVNQQGDALADIDADGQLVPEDPSTFACRIRISPGLNRLKVVLPSGKTIERAVITVEGWETDVHLERRQYLRGAATDIAGGTVMMRREGAAPDPQFDRLTQTALYALVHEREVLSDRMDALLDGKFENPLFGLIAAHLVLRDRGANDGLLPVILYNTGALLGRDHPDLKALGLTQPRTAPGPVVFDVPPLLRKSWDLIVAGTFDGTAEIDPRSSAGAVCGRVVPGGPWLAWKDLDASDAADDATGLRSGIREVLSDFVKQVRTQVPSLSSLGQATLGADDASLDEDDKVELGRTLGVPRHLLDSMLQKLGS